MQTIPVRRLVSFCAVLVCAFFVFGANAPAATLTVDATDDIYAAGHSSLPTTIYPGTFPPIANFASGPNQVLTFSSVTGLVGCNFVLTNGPDGTCFPGVSTTVTSYGGLSGISVNQANFFLVGVFLDATEPSGAGPSILKYNYGGGLDTSDPTFSPEINQVFFIGDGLTGTGGGQQQIFYVPSAATALSLGFADSFDSAPSYYADNVGSLSATFDITTAAEPGPSLFVLSGLVVMLALGRKSKDTNG